MLVPQKCSFYVQQQAASLERSLAQCATFWHDEHVLHEGSGFLVHSQRLTALSDARMQAKGAVAAAMDARDLSKGCCALPRHPSKPLPTHLDQLPSSMHCYRLAIAGAAECPELRLRAGVEIGDAAGVAEGCNGGSDHERS